MGESKVDLLQGTLDLLILKTLALEPMRGWGIAQRIQQCSREVFRVGSSPSRSAIGNASWPRSRVSCKWCDEGRSIVSATPSCAFISRLSTDPPPLQL